MLNGFHDAASAAGSLTSRSSAPADDTMVPAVPASTNICPTYLDLLSLDLLVSIMKTTQKMNKVGVRPAATLAACITIALTIPAAQAAARVAYQTDPTPVLSVTNCRDSGPGSLRDALAVAVDGSAVDLTQLTCGLITLTTGELSISVNNLNVTGSAIHALVISADSRSRVMAHHGNGLLTLQNITLENGRNRTQQEAKGGCLYAHSDVLLEGVNVRNCQAIELTTRVNIAEGGGIFVLGSATIVQSSVTGNSALGHISPYYNFVGGGGISVAGDLRLFDSTVSSNVAGSFDGVSDHPYQHGGGIDASGDAFISGSTISSNRASITGGVSLAGASAVIESSTISGNVSVQRDAGVTSYAAYLGISNSTIAFNTTISDYTDDAVGGVSSLGRDPHVELQSSIIANNLVNGVERDFLRLPTQSGTVTGANNLIMSSNIDLPSDTLSVDPRLGPLLNHGGPTQTHALLSGSPAIDAGNNRLLMEFDQRGAPFSRVVGAAADIGAFEWSPASSGDALFFSGFE